MLSPVSDKQVLMFPRKLDKGHKNEASPQHPWTGARIVVVSSPKLIPYAPAEHSVSSHSPAVLVRMSLKESLNWKNLQ